MTQPNCLSYNDFMKQMDSCIEDKDLKSRNNSLKKNNLEMEDQLESFREVSKNMERK